MRLMGAHHHHTILAFATAVTVFCVVAALCAYGPLVHAQVAETPCYTTFSNIDLPAGYGAPLSFFAGYGSLSVQALCGDEGVRVRVGLENSDIFIYQYAYHRGDQGWERITLAGDDARGPWFVGSAEGFVEDPGDEGNIVAYMCEKVDGAWKCGCRDEACAVPFWQLQTYRTQSGSLANLEELLQAETSDELYISQPSTYHAAMGDEITIYGNAFSTASAGNMVYVGEHVLKGVISENGNSVTFPMPDVPVGKYRVHLERDGERTEYGTVVWLQDGELEVPKISSVSPEEGKQGDTFTVYGSGFMPEGNDLVTTFGVLDGLSSQDGTSITFRYDPFDEQVDFRNEDGSQRDHSQPVHVTAVTAGGVSVEPVVFYLSM